LKNGPILKIIYDGSYARSGKAHDPVGRYFSDFDIREPAGRSAIENADVGSAASEGCPARS
jgi:hypothetical protein